MSLAEFLEAESLAAEEAEAEDALRDPDEPLPSHVTVTRGYPRSRNLQVRFREDELVLLAAYAAEQGLPVSTLVRSLVLDAIAPVDDVGAAFGRLEADLHRLRWRVVTGKVSPMARDGAPAVSDRRTG